MNSKVLGRIAGLTLLGAAFVASNIAPSAATAAAEGDPVVMFDETDSRMNAAQDTARAQLSRFLDHVLDARGFARDGAAIKVAVPLPDGGNEVIWIAPFARENNRFIGALANEPQMIADAKAGDLMAFEADQVRDWSFYGKDGRMYGSYTTRVLLSQLDPVQAAQIEALLSDTPVPADW